jgi:putative membrane protein
MYGRLEVLTFLPVLLVAACATSPLPQPAKSAGVSDAEIAAIVVAANSVDAEMGDLALERATSADVKQFGKTMGTDHRAVNEAAVALVGKLNVTPVESVTSRKLRADGAAVKADLTAKSGAEFDRAYITHEVNYHRAVIAAVDELLIPNATNAELKATLISVRPAFVAHLQHAEHLLAGLK